MKLIIGANANVLYVEELLLGRSSEFLRTALKKEWQEGNERQILLPEEDVTTFTTYVHWCYTGAILCKAEGEEVERIYVLLAKLYVLGERPMDNKLQNRVIDAIAATTREFQPDGKRYHPAGEAINIIYEGTLESSPVRRMLADLWHQRGKATWLRGATVKPNATFLEDVLTKFLGSGQRSDSAMNGVPRAYYKEE